MSATSTAFEPAAAATTDARAWPSAEAAAQSRLAYQILHLGFTVAPLLFGLDKFFNLMTQWSAYLPGFVTAAVPGHVVMGIVGVIEIAAGVGVWLLPRVFAHVVAAWLALIIVALALAGGFWDVALRDFGLMLGALALGRLARAHS